MVSNIMPSHHSNNFYIEDAACFWLSIDPMSKKGLFLREYSRLVRIKKKIDDDSQFLISEDLHNDEEFVAERDFDEMFYLRDSINPFIDSKRTLANDRSDLLPESYKRWKNDIKNQTLEFKEILEQFNHLVRLFYCRSNLPKALQESYTTNHLKEIVEQSWKKEGVGFNINNLTQKRILIEAVNIFLEKDSASAYIEDVSISISRTTLLDIAKEKGLKPPFLYQTSCVQPDTSITTLNKRNLYLVVHILAKALNYIPYEASSVGKALRALESLNLSIDSKTLRGYLKSELSEIQEFPQIIVHPRQEASLLKCIYAFSAKLKQTPVNIEELVYHEGAGMNPDDFTECVKQAKKAI